VNVHVNQPWQHEQVIDLQLGQLRWLGRVVRRDPAVHDG
jgi:hypothetical protein